MEDEEPLASTEDEPAAPACPMCGGEDLYYGQAGHQIHNLGNAHVFFPQDKLLSSYEMGAFVCLGCGYVGQYIDNRDLEKLRSWVNKQREKAARKQRQG